MVFIFPAPHWLSFKGNAVLVWVRRSLWASFLRLVCQYLLVSVAALTVAILMQISEELEEKGMLGKECTGCQSMKASLRCFTNMHTHIKAFKGEVHTKKSLKTMLFCGTHYERLLIMFPQLFYTPLHCLLHTVKAYSKQRLNEDKMGKKYTYF